VHRAELLESDDERATFEIECSSGTYIRTLIETLEDAYCETLRRTAIGPFAVPEGESLEISVEDLVSFLPERILDEDEAAAVSHGRPVIEPFDVPPTYARLTHDGHLVAVARVDGENLRPEVVLA
jgi:tRNA pseudouridine55 synthase